MSKRRLKAAAELSKVEDEEKAEVEAGLSGNLSINEAESSDSGSDSEVEAEGAAFSDSGDESEADPELEFSDREEDGRQDDDEEASDNEELDRALLDVIQARDVREQAAVKDAMGAAPSLRSNPDSNDGPDEDADDSSEDEESARNTVGDVPLKWYQDEEHIGYDRVGQKLLRKAKKDKLDELLDRNDNIKAWRTIYDEYNDEEITLSKEEIELIQRIRQGQFPHVEINPYEPENDWYTREQEIHPLHNAPEPKRRFMPSKWEEKRIVKLVRALRKGWIKRESDVPKEPDTYLLWDESGSVREKTATGLTFIPATKARLPGHEESYNPPKEYLPTEEERNASQLLSEEDQQNLVPQSFDSLRKVPAYDRFINERFERCLDLYLCPRTRKKRVFVKDPETLIPKLPRPQDLQPFPTTLLMQFLGHTAPVYSVAPSPDGQWLASASGDGTLKLWEVATGRCLRTIAFDQAVRCCAWCPDQNLSLISVSSGHNLFLLYSGLGSEEVEAETLKRLELQKSKADKQQDTCQWRASNVAQGLELLHKFPVHHVSWHNKGDYFTSLAPAGNTQAVLVHQLSKQATQNPFRKNRGKVARVLFHPLKPFLFVAAQNSVRVYNLAKQELAKRLVGGSGPITSMAIHPSGDHVILGSEDNRLAWYDLDLSTKPYRALRYHKHALRAVAFHRSYPLFASSSDDATVHVFHGMVYQDLMTNPLIVPVKILRSHKMVDYRGVLDCAFHPKQPWIFTAGGDFVVSLFTN